MTLWLGSIATLALVMAVTPGPNNLVFAASGARFGFVRTVPALLGMLAGFVVVLALSVAGVGALVAAEPRLQLALRVVGSAYMLWLAVELWMTAAGPAHSPRAADTSPRWWHLAVLQLMNPKTWLASVTFVSGYLGASSPGRFGVDLLGVTCFLVVVALSASSWVCFGAALRVGLSGRQWRSVNRVLAALAACTVTTFWLR